MIYYFSGTGNSRAVAHQLAKLTHDTCCDISKPEMLQPVSASDISIGFVFPVYAWGLPLIVTSFFQHHFVSLLHKRRGQCYVYAVFTCGGDIGYADEEFRTLLASLGRMSLPLHGVWSVRMPNTYVCFPLYDTDYGFSAQKKITETSHRLYHIAHAIQENLTEVHVHRGCFPSLKSGALKRSFNRYFVTDRFFYVLADRCVRCGRCVGNCPTSDIQMNETPPYIEWIGGNCTGCLRCFHLCPANAIQFGKYTIHKHQHSVPPTLFESEKIL